MASCSCGGVLCSLDAEPVDVLAVLGFSHVVRGRCALRAFGSSLDSLEFADERDFLTLFAVRLQNTLLKLLQLLLLALIPRHIFPSLNFQYNSSSF